MMRQIRSLLEPGRGVRPTNPRLQYVLMMSSKYHKGNCIWLGRQTGFPTVIDSAILYEISLSVESYEVAEVYSTRSHDTQSLQ